MKVLLLVVTNPLLYADDLVLVADSPEKLQSLLKVLSHWSAWITMYVYKIMVINPIYVQRQK